MKKKFSERQKVRRCNIIKELVSKTEGELISSSIHKYAQNFFAVVDQLREKNIKDKLLHDKISLEEFTQESLTRECVNAILKYKNHLKPEQALYFEEINNLNTEHFTSFYVVSPEKPNKSLYLGL